MSSSGIQGGPPQTSPDAGDRAQAKVRWPHPDRASLVIAGVWVVGLLLALAVPAMIVGPTEEAAPEAEVWVAFGCTVAGAGVMLFAAWALYRHSRDWADAVWGIVPAASVVVGGVILTASKLTGV